MFCLPPSGCRQERSTTVVAQAQQQYVPVALVACSKCTRKLLRSTCIKPQSLWCADLYLCPVIDAHALRKVDKEAGECTFMREDSYMSYDMLPLPFWSHALARYLLLLAGSSPRRRWCMQCVRAWQWACVQVRAAALTRSSQLPMKLSAVPAYTTRPFSSASG